MKEKESLYCWCYLCRKIHTMYLAAPTATIPAIMGCPHFGWYDELEAYIEKKNTHWRVEIEDISTGEL